MPDLKWREQAIEHRRALEQLGFHAGPVFRVGDYVTWGQDRFPLLEAELARHFEGVNLEPSDPHE